MLSQTTEYAMRAVMCLAQNAGQAMTVAQVAIKTQVPEKYLAKILQGLVRFDIVHSQRGPSGGFTLVPAPAEVTMMDIVDAVDPIERIHSCPLRLNAHGTRLCQLHRKLDDAIAHLREAFTSTTFQDLLVEPGSVPLCDISRKDS